MRLDQVLTKFKLAPSRSKAQALIQAGSVDLLLNGKWKTVEDVSFSAAKLKQEEIRITNSSLLKYVSRGGLKLESALSARGVQVQGLRCLDVGQSTGGFTHCLLSHGAKEVVGFDVGQGQLHESLRLNPNVVFYEGVHVRDLPNHLKLTKEFQKPFDLVVVDVSFISLAQVFPVLAKVLQKGVPILALVKPQFELDAKSLNKKGVVKSEELLHSVKSKISDLALEHGFKILDYFPSALKGTDGNQEFFLHAEFLKLTNS